MNQQAAIDTSDDHRAGPDSLARHHDRIENQVEQVRAPLVAICIATYKRPQFLRNLLTSIVSMEIAEFRPYLIIADNDECMAARPIVNHFANEMTFPVIYVMEPRRGIASVRNRLVQEATTIGAEFIAFVDDDETVEPSWLRELVILACSARADAVAGACVVEFEDNAPRWVGNLELKFTPRRQASGSVIKRGSTANALFKIGSLRQIPGPFDERMNLSGGSDTLLFAQLYRMGFKLVYCNESVVHELYPSTRASVSWILKRYYRTGITGGRTARWIEPSARSIMLFIAKTLFLFAKSVLLLIPVLPRGKGLVVSRIAPIAVAFGNIIGLMGRGNRLQEYRQIHGR